MLAEARLDFEEEMELEDSVEELEPLSFLLGRLARSALRAIGGAFAWRPRHSCAIRSGAIACKNDVQVVEAIALAGKITTARHMKSSDPARADAGFQDAFESASPAFASGSSGGADPKIFLAADPARPRAMQKRLFVPVPRSGKTGAYHRAAGESGGGFEYRLAGIDGHASPRRISMSRFCSFARERTEEPSKSCASCARKTATKRCGDSDWVSSFQARAAGDVELQRRMPARVSFRGMRGEVVAASGPWRTSGDWWREDAWSRTNGIWNSLSALRWQLASQTSSAWPRIRSLPYLLRCDAPELVCAGNLRLMYIELHARSAFSFLEGASMPEELAGVCAEHGMPAMALLDRDGVYGAPRFHLAAKKKSHSRAHRRGSHVARPDGAIRCSWNRARDIRISAA